MKFSVSSYSYHDYISSDRLGFLGIIDKTAELGFDGIEYATTTGWTEEPDAGKRIRERAAEKGIEVVALAVGADFLNDPDAVAKTKAYVDLAVEMGASRMRHDITGGFRDRKICRGYDDALKTVVPAIREVAEYAAERGVATMTENHGFFSQDAARVEKLINEVAHPNFGALVDIGNFMCADEDPAASVGILAPYAVHVHAKDFFFRSGVLSAPGQGWFQTRGGNFLRGTIIGHGDAKAEQSIRVLKKAGYDDYITVEFEGMEDPLIGIAYGLANLRRFAAQ